MDTTQLLKGVLDVAVLAVITAEDGYGYDVVRRLRAAGLDEVAEASVYGTLRRLYASGALSTYVVPSDGGPHRKYYAITPQGAIMLDEQRRSWSRFSATLSALIGATVIRTGESTAESTARTTVGAAAGAAGASTPPKATAAGGPTGTAELPIAATEGPRTTDPGRRPDQRVRLLPEPLPAIPDTRSIPTTIGDER